jgi:hypothetical protein
MSPTGIGLVALACTLVGVGAGMALRTRLPEHHLSGESKDTVMVGMGWSPR